MQTSRRPETRVQNESWETVLSSQNSLLAHKLAVETLTIHSVDVMNRTRHNRIIKIKRTRDGSIHKILKPIQPRVRLVTLRKRKVSNDDDNFATKKKRVRLSESRAMNRIVLPFESSKKSTDKHLLFFKNPRSELGA